MNVILKDTAQETTNPQLNQYAKPTQQERTFTDGFDYDVRYKRNVPYNYYQLSIDATLPIRDPGLFVPRFHCVPNNFNVPFEPFQALQFQVKIFTGSWVWGYKFTTGAPAVSDDFQVQFENSVNT